MEVRGGGEKLGELSSFAPETITVPLHNPELGRGTRRRRKEEEEEEEAINYNFFCDITTKMTSQERTVYSLDAFR